MDLIVLEYELNINALLDEYNNHYNINSFLYEDGPDTSSSDFSADINEPAGGNDKPDTGDNKSDKDKPVAKKEMGGNNSGGNNSNKKGIIDRIFEAISNFFSNIASLFKKTSVEGEAAQKLKLIEETLKEHPDLRNRKITVPWYNKTPLKSTIEKFTKDGKEHTPEELSKIYWDEDRQVERTVGEVFDYVKANFNEQDSGLKEALRVIEDTLYNKKADDKKPEIIANLANGFAKGNFGIVKLIPTILTGVGITYKLGKEHGKNGVIKGTANTVVWGADKVAKQWANNKKKKEKREAKEKAKELKRKEKEEAKSNKEGMKKKKELKKRVISFVKDKFPSKSSNASKGQLSEIFDGKSADEVIKQANSITRALGGKVQFDSIEEFERFFNSGEPLEL